MLPPTSAPRIPTTRSSLAAGLVAGLALLAAGLPCLAQQAGGLFREGTCSGVLCDTIGGPQAPAARQQASLFREGECGGVLCDAIGGSQAPKRNDPPPNCGGGLLCDLMPYRMGASLSGAGSPRGRQEAETARPALAPAAEAPRKTRRKAVAAAKSARTAEGHRSRDGATETAAATAR